MAPNNWPTPTYNPPPYPPAITHVHNSIQDDANFTRQYTPCSSDTVYHDLTCGHRVISLNLSENCAVTCITPGSRPAAPFICPECLVRDVRLAMDLAGLGLTTTDDVDMQDAGRREERIQALANEEVARLRKQGYRMCRVTEKLETPRLQFCNEWMKEEGWGGVNDGVGEAQGERKFKRPGITMRAIAAGKMKIRGKGNGAVQVQGEDDATKAVRMALEKCVIG